MNGNISHIEICEVLETSSDPTFITMSSVFITETDVTPCCFVCVSGGVGITCWLVVSNKVVAIGLHAVS